MFFKSTRCGINPQNWKSTYKELVPKTGAYVKKNFDSIYNKLYSKQSCASVHALVDEWDNLCVLLWLKTGALYEMIISYKSTIFVYRLTGIICNVQSIVKLHVMYTWSTCKSRSEIEIIYTFIFDVYLLCRWKKEFLFFFVKKSFKKCKGSIGW